MGRFQGNGWQFDPNDSRSHPAKPHADSNCFRAGGYRGRRMACFAGRVLAHAGEACVAGSCGGEATSYGVTLGIIVVVEVSPYQPFPDDSDVAKSRRTREVRIWVETRDKSLGFPP